MTIHWSRIPHYADPGVWTGVCLDPNCFDGWAYVRAEDRAAIEAAHAQEHAVAAREPSGTEYRDDGSGYGLPGDRRE